MNARLLTPLRVLPMIAVLLAACGGGEVTAPITLGDLTGQYAVTDVSIYFKTDPPFRVDAGALDGVEVDIESTGDFTVAATAVTGLNPESGRISIAGNVLTVATTDTGNLFLTSGPLKFSYRNGVLSLTQEDIPQLVGLDMVTVTATTQLTKR
jgi:hypothetical protein